MTGVTKRCTRCGVDKRCEEFRTIPSRGLHSWCRECESSTAGIRQAARQRPAAGRRWADRHDACVVCGRTSVRHAARGRCITCYVRVRRLEAS